MSKPAEPTSFLRAFLRSRASRGFSLAELLVVITILLVLSTIAVGSYLMFRDAGEDTAAQAMLNEIATNQRFHHRDFGEFLTDPLDLAEVVGDRYTYLPANLASEGPTEASVGSPDGSQVTLAARSKSGTCYAVTLYADHTEPLTDNYPVGPSLLCDSSTAAVRASTPALTNSWGFEE